MALVRAPPKNAPRLLGIADGPVTQSCANPARHGQNHDEVRPVNSTAPRSTSPSSWALLVAVVVAITVLLALMISPVYALVVPFWLVGVWAVFWVIRLAVRYGVNDALHANRHWVTAPDRDRVES
jgi:sterol desaturase/sphingolipid hydroxylase (fatty acid hydroxylase superfamily)